MTTIDPYAVTAGAYDLLNGSARPGQLAALELLLPRLRPKQGPILDIGAGSGLNTAVVLERLPEARVQALEPSRAMRALALARIAAHPQWRDRVTVRPEDFFAAPLPEHLGGAIALGVIGHFDAGERAALLAELGDRLPPGGAALIDLQSPPRPAVVPPAVFADVRVGDLSYRGIAEGRPVGTELMRWRMTYLTLDGERVLVEDVVEFEFRHPSPTVVAQEAEQVGLVLERLGSTTFWLVLRR
ncbi:class I SAM-dependent methyltransferase [Granulicoccus phenolivorans]|uniref:class I SAM-dependent methyltransferase n=1 Tax=Granulicoccus phenolivorans TaxID=266854 RepID=UPI0004176627|nr:class I SAM-dependent methyltransferase [Granulicoccus phenolivorans]